MLDVTGNNIANVNTAGFKSSSVEFEDTLSQLVSGATAAGAANGGSNPAQIGLGVKVAGISTNFAQGSSQATGKPTNLMITGDGFFNVRMGGQNLYTRAGDFDFDGTGTLVSAEGGFVQGWTADATGNINTNQALGNIKLPVDSVVPAAATTNASFAGNLPSDAAAATTLTRDIPVYDNKGNKSTVTLTFTSDGAGNWAVNDGAGPIGTLSFAAGVLTTTPPTLTAAGALPIDFSNVSGFAGLSTIAVSGQDGHSAGTLDSYTIGKDGTISGSYSNGVIQAIARIAVSTFVNPGGLEKEGGSMYAATPNSGAQTTGTAGTPGLGAITTGYLEMSNVDLSQEFTNLIVAQRGFQANSKVITTSDEILQTLVNMKN
jgi:flagellar hook protein FlgE